jgi:metal-responsive CopG/Arc/MetJ family transcriptional regulator
VAIKKEDSQAFTVKFPKTLVEEIDQICSTYYITRTSWLIRAARELLEKERAVKTEEILAKIASKERNE